MLSFRLLMFIEHFVLGWLSAVPLLILLVLMKIVFLQYQQAHYTALLIMWSSTFFIFR